MISAAFHTSGQVSVADMGWGVGGLGTEQKKVLEVTFISTLFFSLLIVLCVCVFSIIQRKKLNSENWLSLLGRAWLQIHRV